MNIGKYLIKNRKYLKFNNYWLDKVISGQKLQHDDLNRCKGIETESIIYCLLLYIFLIKIISLVEKYLDKCVVYEVKGFNRAIL